MPFHRTTFAAVTSDGNVLVVFGFFVFTCMAIARRDRTSDLRG